MQSKGPNLFPRLNFKTAGVLALGITCMSLLDAAPREISTAGPSANTTANLGIAKYKVISDFDKADTVIQGLDGAGKAAFEMTSKKSGATTIRILPSIKNKDAIGAVAIVGNSKVQSQSVTNEAVFQASIQSILRDLSVPGRSTSTSSQGGGSTENAQSNDVKACSDGCGSKLFSCVNSIAGGNMASTMVGASLCVSKWSVCLQLCSPSSNNDGGGRPHTGGPNQVK